jgi:serine/threonine protein kinase
VIKTMLQTRKPPRVQMLLFDREKEIAVQLMHPNVVRAERAGAWNEIHFIEMEFMDGGSVWDLMTGGTRALPLDRAAPIILQALEGLAYAHEASVSVTTDKGKKTQRGVIHRDLKPPNILLTHQGGRVVAKLSDFGLAKSFAAAGCTQGSLSQSQAGSFCGSPCYMAPEHICNYKYVKPPTDVFEMAATFFHMLTGRPVWPLGPGKDIFKVILESEPLRLKDHLPSCPKPLAQVFDRALARDPAERPASGQELLDAMRKVLK